MLNWNVSIGKKKFTLTPVRLSIYRQAKIVKATDDRANAFYLFFIKDTFFHAAQLKQVPDGSMLSRIERNSISFPASHPLTESLAPDNSAFRSIPMSLLIQKIFEKHGSLNGALFLTFFDGCLPRETILQELKKALYQFKRNGQLLAAYKLLHYYLDFAPDDSFASDMLSNLSFQPYEKRYRNTLTMEDPDFLEFLCFDRISEKKCFDILLNIYQQQARWMEELACRSRYLALHQNRINFHPIEALLLQKLTDKQQTLFLQHLLSSGILPEEITALIFNRLTAEENYTDMLRLIAAGKVTVTKEDLPAVTKSFLQADLSIFLPVMEELTSLLPNLYSDDPDTLDRITTRFLAEMLKTSDVASVKTRLEKFTAAGISLPSIEMIESMLLLQEDPDQQLALGKLYLHFHQYEQAIDCFKWEIELNPSNPVPIQSLIRVYSYLNEQEEAQAYTQLLHQINKDSGPIGLS